MSTKASFDKIEMFVYDNVDIKICPICKSKNIVSYLQTLHCHCLDCGRNQDYAATIFSVADGDEFEDNDVIGNDECVIFFCISFIITSNGEVYHVEENEDGKYKISYKVYDYVTTINDKFMDMMKPRCF